MGLRRFIITPSLLRFLNDRSKPIFRPRFVLRIVAIKVLEFVKEIKNVGFLVPLLLLSNQLILFEFQLCLSFGKRVDSQIFFLCRVAKGDAFPEGV